MNTLTFAPGQIGYHGRAGSRDLTWSDSCFRRIPLAIVLRTDERGQGWEMGGHGNKVRRIRGVDQVMDVDIAIGIYLEESADGFHVGVREREGSKMLV